MYQRCRMFSLGRVAAASATVSLVLGFFAPTALAGHSHPFRGAATLVGRIRACGGPPPGRCRLATARVIATNDNTGASASGTAKSGKFSYRLRPGTYTVVVKFSGSKQQRRVVVPRHETTRVRFTFHIH
jgi:Carboxypeptidase regulatory-like domain